MKRMFEELDYRVTPIGAISLRRRTQPSTGEDIFEIKLGEEFLMSSAFTASEIALATLALEALSGNTLDIVVGGLGLGYTAKAVLDSKRVANLLVVDALEAVIDWHASGLLPLGSAIANDPRCRLLQADFFSLAASENGFDPAEPGRKVDAVLVDIDHSPSAHLTGTNAKFYTESGLGSLSRHLKPGGVFALWSNEPPDGPFTELLNAVFEDATAEPVIFKNPLQQNRDVTQTVYLTTAARAPMD